MEEMKQILKNDVIQEAIDTEMRKAKQQFIAKIKKLMATSSKMPKPKRQSEDWHGAQKSHRHQTPLQME